MSEEKTQQPDSDNGAGIQPQASSLIADAHTAAERLKAENDRRERLLKAEQELEARKTLMGRAEIGPPPKKEETPQEYARRIEQCRL